MKIITMIFAALIVSAGTVFAAGPQLTDETKALLTQAKQSVNGVPANDVKKEMAEGKIVLIDVRDPDEWVTNNGIAYERSVQISRGFLEVKYPKLILAQYNKDDRFIVYCALEPRSVLAAKRMKELGFSDVRYLEGGLKNWQ